MPNSKSSSVTDARTLAAEVLVRVWGEDAFAAAALTATLSRHPQLDPRDAGLTTELVFGVLRTEGALERRLDRLAKNPRYKTQPHVKAHLFIAAYSLFFLDRVPDHAAVDAAVRGIKAREGQKVAGFANAVLRKLAAGDRAITRVEAARQTLPRWLRRGLREQLGEAGLDATLGGGETPPISLCLAADEDPQTWLARLQEAGGRWERGKLSPRCLLGWGAGDSDRLPGAHEAWRVQEEGAQVLGLLVGAAPGETVLDACAGRGGKTLLFLDAVGPSGAVDAADLHPRKLERLRERPGGDRVRDVYGVDWTRGQGGIEGTYDVVVVDAPCTGTGTLRRRPEIARRLGKNDPARMAELQLAIARSAATRVKPGGRLVYAVCSLLREEGVGVAEALASEGELEPVSFPGRSAVPGLKLDERPAVALTPGEHETDGYYVACFQRRG